MATLRKINATGEYDPNYGSIRKIDSLGQYDPAGTMRLMTAPLSGPAPEPDLIDTGIIIGREILPAIAGSFIGSIGGPLGIAGGGAAGASIGNWWSQKYRIEKGFQEEYNLGELGAATAIGAVPLSALPGKGALARTAIRGVEGSALATGELAARTYLDEGRAPTGDEVATTLLFGATLGGGLGALEAKWLNRKLGTAFEGGENKQDVLQGTEKAINDANGPQNFEVINKLAEDLSPTRKGYLENWRSPTKFIPIEKELSNREYAEQLLANIDKRLMYETDDMVRGLAKTEQVAPEFQPIKEAFEKKIASDNELFTGINPIVAKGNLADNKRLREIDAEIEELNTRGYIRYHYATGKAKIARLEKERERLQLKHGIIQVRGGAAGLAVGGTALTQAEEEELREIGPWALGMGLIAGAVLPIGAVKSVVKDGLGFIKKIVTPSIRKGKAEGEEELAQAAKTGKPPPPVEPTKSVKVKDPNKVKDMRSLHFPQLIAILNNKSKKTLDLLTVDMAVRELARRATVDSNTARRLQKTMEDLVSEGQSRNTKVTVGELGRERLKRSIDPDVQTEASLPPGQGRGYLPGEREQVVGNMKKDELLEAIQRDDLNTPAAIDEALERASKKPKTRKFFETHAPKIFPTIIASGVSVGAVMEALEEDDGELKQAGMGGMMMLILAGALGYRGYKKFLKTKQGKQLKIAAKLDARKIEPDVIKSNRIDLVDEKSKSMYVNPSEFAETMKDIKDKANFLLVPISRNLKKINPILTAVFREHDGKIRTRTRELMDRASPFVVKMTTLLKPTLTNKKDAEKFQEFKFYLLNGEFGEIAKLLDRMHSSKIINTSEQDALGEQLKTMRDTLDEIRVYAREEGGIDVGYFKDYFPRQIKNYKAFRKYLDENDATRDVRNEIDIALDEYAKKFKYASIDLIPPEEAAEVASRVLRGFPVKGGEAVTPNFKKRSIKKVTPDMLEAYADPADSLKTYIERSVDATERRIFLGRKPTTPTKTVGFEGSLDRISSDLGLKMNVDESLADSVATRILKEKGLELSRDDVAKLREIIQARFSGKSVSPLIQGLKNAGYIQVMGNFGSAITQLAELAYAFHFHGFGNTFHSLFNRKENFNFTKHFGLQDHHIDAQTSAGGLSKLLDKVFTGVGLKKLDQLSKNTIMNASWKKYRKQALSKNGARKLKEELDPVFGVERSREMISDLVNMSPNSKELPKSVEELVFYKFLDLNPATLTEMPMGYTSSGDLRIAYMLKTFTIKQFDVYREAAGEDINRAFLLKKQGKNKEAAREAAKGVAKLAGLATVFAAANASTDVVKDTLAGRPTKLDEMVVNNSLRLLGVNRHLIYKSKREGVARSLLEMALPPTAVFDRAGKDINDVILSDKDYRGNMLQGTPFDLIYWRYLGGLDKIKE